ncbi:ABC transporter substrate-binding protein [Microbacterium sp. M3]|uniref:ABC transporter substrate-binding protein n=1 Tax=Microbacterium arthrosphaerae TaxID=792652 RepID=A0ABU4H2F3_9MICO|nr:MULTISPECIES: ABC transporter substrate-binding protein [Microbacterium]MDW4573519.1 ABC transporter substrate-binding protein [Microbacterium arthrosphaerae]MDW7607374.1 ABC transporter substrate-binding protein [Microbacterium sp. M3]
MASHRLATAAGLALLLSGLAACAPGLPATVVPGTHVTVGWSEELTSLNASAAPTPGNIDVAAATRGGFGRTIDGAFVPDESFGKVSIVSDDPFTVRYDLAEPVWSDGIPLDAADLALAWAAVAGRLGDDESTPPADAETDSQALTTLDEFGRAIEITFPEPAIDWQSAVTAPVPAHVVGRLAFGIDDAMEAKQAVIRAVQEEDASALAEIADVWATGFEVTEKSEIGGDLLLSSGPFRVEQVEREAEGQTVTLVPNPSYRGAATPQVARVDLVPSGGDPVAAVGDLLDVAQVAPTAENRATIRDLERREFGVQTTHDGHVWTVLLDPAGVFADPAARTAFLRTVPARAMLENGGGEWSSAYTATTSVTTAPDSAAHQIVSEDSGFAAVLGSPSSEPEVEREAAGVAAGSRVCVLYDRGSAFAAGAFAALRDAVAEAGWNAVDCGSDDVDAAIGQRGWDAAIARVPIAQTPAELAEQWGSGSEGSLTTHADADRDALIAQLARTVDVFDARELLAQIEATIVRAAVARPLAVDPRLTLVDPGVAGVSAPDGAVAPLLGGAAQWSVVP